jgi:hypothetical protein
LFFSTGRDLFFKAFVGNKRAWGTIHFEGEPVELIEIVLGAGMRTFDLPDVAARDVEEEGEVVLGVTVGLPVVCYEPDDRKVELRFSCLSHRRCKKMKRMSYLAYKIISKIQRPPTDPLHNLRSRLMMEDLLYRIQSNVDVATAEEAIARLPAEYGTVLDLHYGWGLSRREIAALLNWSPGKVSQRLTRAISLLKYELHPEAFRKARTLLNRST